MSLVSARPTRTLRCEDCHVAKPNAAGGIGIMAEPQVILYAPPGASKYSRQYMAALINLNLGHDSGTGGTWRLNNFPSSIIL